MLKVSVILKTKTQVVVTCS